MKRRERATRFVRIFCSFFSGKTAHSFSSLGTSARCRRDRAVEEGCRARATCISLVFFFYCCPFQNKTKKCIQQKRQHCARAPFFFLFFFLTIIGQLEAPTQSTRPQDYYTTQKNSAGQKGFQKRTPYKSPHRQRAVAAVKGEKNPSTLFISPVYRCGCCGMMKSGTGTPIFFKMPGPSSTANCALCCSQSTGSATCHSFIR